MEDPNRIRRKGTRFPPDPNTTLTLEAEGDERPPLVGLVVDESYEGCSAVFRDTPALRQGAKFLCTLGRMAPVEGSVVWRRVLEEGIVRVGVAFAIQRPGRKV